MRIFGSERMDGMLQRLGLQEGEAIVHPWINKALEKAQQKVEARNFDIRKNLLKFDDVMNDQRKVVYEQRRELMEAEDIADAVREMREEVVEDIVHRAMPPKVMPEQWDMDFLHEEVRRLFNLDLPVQDWAKEEGIAEEEMRERIQRAVDEKMAAKVANYGVEVWRMVEKSLLLQILDQTWKEHLLQLDHLRQGIGLRAYAQRDPLNEYKGEAFELFQQMLAHLRERVTQVLAMVELQTQPTQEELDAQRDRQEMREQHQAPEQQVGGGSVPGAEEAGGTTVATRAAAADVDPAAPATWGRVSRNAPCPCGSGKKYKHCHGTAA